VSIRIGVSFICSVIFRSSSRIVLFCYIIFWIVFMSFCIQTRDNKDTNYWPVSVPLEMRILTREHFNRWYRLAPYYISMLLVEIPFQASCAAMYLIVSYWLTGQPVETSRIVSFMIICIAATLTAQAWGFFIGATTPVKVKHLIGEII